MTLAVFSSHPDIVDILLPACLAAVFDTISSTVLVSVYRRTYRVADKRFTILSRRIFRVKGQQFSSHPQLRELDSGSDEKVTDGK